MKCGVVLKKMRIVPVYAAVLTFYRFYILMHMQLQLLSWENRNAR